MRNKIKKLKHFLEHFDFIWSVPFAIMLFMLVGFFVITIDPRAGFYELSHFQSTFLVVTIIIILTNVSVLGLRFTFKSLYKYLYGYKDENGKYINESKKEWKDITPMQRIIISLFVFFSFFWGAICIFIKI